MVPEFIDLIMKCINSTTLNVLWNGCMTNEFTPTRGLQLGDLFSPYIFILCTGKLSHVISDVVNNKSWVLIKARKNGPLILHLMFVDDLILFGEASQSHIGVIMNCLNEFCQTFGKKVNQAKTSMFFSQNVKLDLRNRIAARCGFSPTADLGMYLGIPLVQKRVNKNIFSFIVNSVQENWLDGRLSAFLW